ncbi:GNAT family N-acetyltransferase [Hirschia litorea]|uniref:GNAT family N-acetyltransferase n=1 Tax=Hirschia litorea TaxID=1199156 RepID=A0ABW2IK92_9PROT
MPIKLRIIDPAYPSYSILSELPEHAQSIEALYDRCFGPGRSAKTAERLRENNIALSQLSMVAVDSKGEVVAAVRLWPLQIGASGRAVFVGPVAVDDQYRGSRLGLILTEQCLDLAKQAGWPLAILIGNEGYFGKMGFVKISTSDYPTLGYIPPHKLLAMELKDNALVENVGALSVPRVSKPAS